MTTSLGGQKARISFARAIYRDSDIYLFDDPLSAVDAMVGDTLFNQGIIEFLIGQGKTVVLITHQVHFLKNCSDIVVLDNGKIAGRGSFESLEQAGINLDFGKSSPEDSSVAVTGVKTGAVDLKMDTDLASDNEETRQRRATTRGSFHEDEVLPGRLRASSSLATRERKSTMKGDVPEIGNTVATANDDDIIPPSHALTTTEERGSGRVGSSIYAWYVNAGGVGLMLAMVISSAGGQVASVLGNFWLSDWGKAAVASYVTRGVPLSDAENLAFVGRYAWLSLLLCVGSTLSTIFLAAHAMRAGKWFHHSLIGSILAAPVSFFDTTPMGRIVNRFANDIPKADTDIAGAVNAFTSIMLTLLAAVATIATSTNGTFLALLLPLAYVYYRIWIYFVRTNTELRRLDAIAMSPVAVQFSQTLAGVTSIRAYKEEKRFFDALAVFADTKSSFDITGRFCSLWLSLRLAFIGNTVSFFVFVLAVATAGQNIIPPESLSLAILYSSQLPWICDAVVQSGAQVESTIVSVERIRYYSTQVPSEETDEDRRIYLEPGNAVPPTWPEAGEVSIREAVMGYRDGPDILKGLTCDLQSKEKIGIAGRTG